MMDYKKESQRYKDFLDCQEKAKLNKPCKDK
jgi:hypothetical protein